MVEETKESIEEHIEAVLSMNTNADDSVEIGGPADLC